MANLGYGVAVDYLDIEAFAEALLKLEQDRQQLEALGKRFQQHIFSTNTLSIQGANIARLITKL